MKSKIIRNGLIVILSMSLLTGFGLGDIKVPGPLKQDDCSNASDKKKCKKKNLIKGAANAGIIALVAKMVIDYNSKQVTPADKVIAEYKKQHGGSLPKSPTVMTYSTKFKSGVVKAGTPAHLTSQLKVVPGKDEKAFKLQEKIEIHDTENNKTVLKTFVQGIDKKQSTTKGGAYSNAFQFTLPQGLAQGVYPINTAVLINNKVAKPYANKVQLVLHVDEFQNYEIVALK